MNSTSVNSVKTEAITLYSHTRRINRGNWGHKKTSLKNTRNAYGVLWWPSVFEKKMPSSQF